MYNIIHMWLKVAQYCERTRKGGISKRGKDDSEAVQA
jgi:hypothetical protein